MSLFKLTQEIAIDLGTANTIIISNGEIVVDEPSVVAIRKSDDRHNYEIDFLLSKSSKICPLEIKSASYKSHGPLDVFCQKFSV